MQQKELTGYPSIDKPWLRYYSKDAIVTDIPKCTVYQNIYGRNRSYTNDIALMYFGKKISYGRLFAEVGKAEKAFVAHGVKGGDNVALCVPATPEAVYAILALNKIGANANMLNPTFTPQQLTDRINDTNAKILIVANELYSRLESVLPHTGIRIVVSFPAANSLGIFVKLFKKAKNIPNTIPWDEFIARGKSAPTSSEIHYHKGTPAIIVYSSGTTGASKGIQLTNDGINATITEYQTAGFKIKRQDRYFAQIPIWFSTGISVTILVPLCLGITVILEPLYDFEIFYRHIKKYKPNFMITASGLLEYLVSKHEISPAYASFKYLAIGGEYVTANTEKKFNHWLEKNGNIERLHKGYGMCECGGTVTSTTSTSNVIGLSGIPTPHVVVGAFDLKTGCELKYGERGELRVLSPCKMLGYYKNPEATKNIFHKDSAGNVWVCTGDMGYVTEDGNVGVLGRINDSYINVQNETIYLFDIERAILDVEVVRQCKVVVSEIDGKQTHIAHIVFFQDNRTAEEIFDQIKEICYKKLPLSHFPRLIKLHDDALPVAPSGKLNIIEMQEDILNLIKLM